MLCLSLCLNANLETRLGQVLAVILVVMYKYVMYVPPHSILISFKSCTYAHTFQLNKPITCNFFPPLPWLADVFMPYYFVSHPSPDIHYIFNLIVVWKKETAS